MIGGFSAARQNPRLVCGFAGHSPRCCFSACSELRTRCSCCACSPTSRIAERLLESAGWTRGTGSSARGRTRCDQRTKRSMRNCQPRPSCRAIRPTSSLSCTCYIPVTTPQPPLQPAILNVGQPLVVTRASVLCACSSSPGYSSFPMAGEQWRRYLPGIWHRTQWWWRIQTLCGANRHPGSGVNRRSSLTITSGRFAVAQLRRAFTVNQ